MNADIQRGDASGSAPRSVTVLGSIEIVYLAVAEDTGGAYSVFENKMAPGAGPPMHVHTREDEAFYVLDGSFDVQIGERSYAATRGWFGFGPRNVPHAFKATGTAPATMLVIVSPAGFEHFFDDLAEATAVPPYDFDRVRAVFAKHGLEIVEPK